MKKLVALWTIAFTLFAGMPALADLYQGWEKYQANDFAGALAEFQPLADEGDAVAQFFMALMHANGQGVKQDDKKVVEWYTKSAEQGYPLAQNNLGVLYQNGQGVEQNYETALEWYRAAVQNDLADAQTNLGVMYANGHGVTQDFVEAFKWFKLAAEQGDVRSQFNLGFMYDSGQGVEKDIKYAYMWVAIAGANGHENGDEAIELLEKEMSKKEIRQAKRLVRSCTNKEFKGC